MALANRPSTSPLTRLFSAICLLIYSRSLWVFCLASSLVPVTMLNLFQWAKHLITCWALPHLEMASTILLSFVSKRMHRRRFLSSMSLRWDLAWEANLWMARFFLSSYLCSVFRTIILIVVINFESTIWFFVNFLCPSSMSKASLKQYWNPDKLTVSMTNIPGHLLCILLCELVLLQL